MKKRKPPILLGIILLALFAAGAVINMGIDPMSLFRGQAKIESSYDHEDGPLDKPRMTADKAEVLTNMRKTSVMGLGSGEQNVPAGKPLLVWQKYKPGKPTPTDSDTAQQWYSNEYRGPTKGKS
jgi:hypothetical protein